MKSLGALAPLAAAGALLVLPTVGQANHGASHGKSDGAPYGKADGAPYGNANGRSDDKTTGRPRNEAEDPPGGKAKGKNKTRDKCVVNKGFVVKGTLVGYTPDAADPGNQETVTITVSKANRHARNSGDLSDTGPDSSLPGTQYTVPTSDAFDVRLVGYEADEAPEAGDRVRIVGKVPVTKKKCVADPDTSLADRYGAVDVRRVKIVDAD